MASSGKDMYIFRENKTEVIWGKLDAQDYVVQEEKESAKKMIYYKWHEGLGHPSRDYLTSNNYSDATNLPKVPKQWQCKTCITSKSVTGLFLSNENTIGPAIDLLALELREASSDR